MTFMEKTKQFFSEVKTELNKVTWPDRKSIIGATTVVCVTVVIVVAMIWVVDLVFSHLLGLVFTR